MSRKNHNSSRFGRFLLSSFVDGSDLYELMGDFEEAFQEKRNREGRLKATLWYWRMVIKSLPFFIFDSMSWGGNMLKNYIRVAVRNLQKHKAYAFINLLGLTMGLTCAILVFVWILDETAYDRFHQNADRLYRVLYESKTSDNRGPYGSGPLGPALKQTIPEVEKSARVFLVDKNPLGYEDKILNVSICGTDPDFLEMFSFPFIHGDARTALSDPEGVVLTEETARKFFNDANPVGRTLQFEWWGRWLEFKVTGVIRDVPVQSHLQFDLFLPITFVRHSGMSLEEWDNGFLFTYVLLQDGSDPENVEAKMAAWYDERFPDSNNRLRLESMNRIHLYHYGGGGPIIYVIIFSFVGVLILIIACLNFMNLSTARAIGRVKEVGLRKVVGSSRVLLIQQFMGESFLMCLLSMIAAFILALLLTPSLNQLLGSSMKIPLTLPFVVGSFFIALVTGLIAGGYPSIYLSSFSITDTLRDLRGTGKKGAKLRKVFVTFQFIISIFLMICVTVVYQQMKYVQGKALGFEREHVLQFNLRGGLRVQYEPIKRALLQNPEIRSVSATNGSFFRRFGTSQAVWEGKEEGEDLYMAIHSVDFDYFQTLSLEMAEGRYFSRDFSTDAQSGIIVNQTAVEAMGMKDPLGKRFVCPVPYGGDKDGLIIGVVKDFHFRSLYEPIQPLILIVAPGWFTDVYIKIDSDNISQTLGFIETTLAEMATDYPLEYRFLDEAIDSLYRSEQRMKVMVQFGTGLALFLACMGLFGLVAYSAERRTKEIGIRKVLGASSPSIVKLMVREYLGSMVISNLVAWPVAYYFMIRWLSKFAYRTQIGLSIFLISSVVLFILTFLTVMVQSLKAASNDPVDSLRYE